MQGVTEGRRVHLVPQQAARALLQIVHVSLHMQLVNTAVLACHYVCRAPSWPHAGGCYRNHLTFLCQYYFVAHLWRQPAVGADRAPDLFVRQGTRQLGVELKGQHVGAQGPHLVHRGVGRQKQLRAGRQLQRLQWRNKQPWQRFALRKHGDRV